MLSRTRRRDVIWFVVLVVVAGALWVTVDRAEAGAPPPDGIDLVFVAVATNFPDALGVGPAAAALNAPIILVPTDPPLPAETEAELLRLNPKEVAIVGGEAVVSQAMFDAISDLLPAATVDRVAGANRYATNVAVSEALYPLEGWASIPASAFMHEVPGDMNYSIGSTHAYNVGGALTAPIQLPHGATVLGVQANVMDIDVGGSVDVALRCHQFGETSTTLATLSTPLVDDPGDIVIETVAISNALVNNQECSYYVTVSGTNSLVWIRNVRVKYRLGAGEL